MLLTETHPHITIKAPRHLPDARFTVGGEIGNDAAIKRASYLASMRLYGPEYLTTCPRHNLFSRPDLWAICGKVRVCDALMYNTECTEGDAT
jgi:hypothetical protein